MGELKPIRTESEYAAAMREIDAFLVNVPEHGSREADYLETLSILVHAYEQSHPDHRIDEKADPVEAIKFHLDRQAKSAKDLAGVLGCTRTRAWEILNRKRTLTLPQIRALVFELGIPADRLIAAYSTAKAKPRRLNAARKAARAKSGRKAPRVRGAERNSSAPAA
jgi:HTH-type transcriptional regulator/antitoxin HigA